MGNWCRVEFPEPRRVKVNQRWQGWTNALKYLGEDGTYVFTLEGDDFEPEEVEEDIEGSSKWDPFIVVFEQL